MIQAYSGLAFNLEDQGWVLDGNVFRYGAEAMLPLFEGKMIHHYDHRWATFDDATDVRDVSETEHGNASFVTIPRYWVASEEVRSRLAGRWNRHWLMGLRNVCRSTDERTLITDAFPSSGVGHSMHLMFVAAQPVCLIGALSSLIVDYVMRQKLGGINMSYFYLEQLPIMDPATFDETCEWDNGVTVGEWIQVRAF